MTRIALLLLLVPSLATAGPELPGKCVPVPRVAHVVDVDSRAINQDGEFKEATSHWKLETKFAFDLDGDGNDDALVPIAATKTTCPEEISWRVYVMRGTCGHDVGVIGPGFFPSVAGKRDRSGFFPLKTERATTAHGGHEIPDMQTTVTTFAFKDGRYQQTSQKTTSGQCHHCARWTCHPPL